MNRTSRQRIRNNNLTPEEVRDIIHAAYSQPGWGENGNYQPPLHSPEFNGFVQRKLTKFQEEEDEETLGFLETSIDFLQISFNHAENMLMHIIELRSDLTYCNQEEAVPESKSELYKAESQVMHAVLDSLPDDYFEDLSSLLTERRLCVPASKEDMLRLLAAECTECLPRHPEYLSSNIYELGLAFFTGLDRPSVLNGDEQAITRSYTIVLE